MQKSRANSDTFQRSGAPIRKDLGPEKCIEAVTVKLPPGMAKYVRENGGSKLIREALVAYLGDN